MTENWRQNINGGKISKIVQKFEKITGKTFFLILQKLKVI